MGAPRDSVNTPVKSVLFSTGAELVGRSVNLLIPFAVLALHASDAATDQFFLYFAISFFFQGTVYNALVTSSISIAVRGHGAPIKPGFVYFLWVMTALAVVSVFCGHRLAGSGNVILIALSVAIMTFATLYSAPTVAAYYSEHRFVLPGILWGLRVVPLIVYAIFSTGSDELPKLLAGIAVADTIRSQLLVRFRPNTRAPTNVDSGEGGHPRAVTHMVLASVIAGLTPLLVRWIAASGNEGSLSTFEAADRLFGAVASLSMIGVGNVASVHVSRLLQRSDQPPSLTRIVRFSCLWSCLWLFAGIMVWLLLPLFAGLIGGEAEALLSLQVRDNYLILALGIPAFVFTGMQARCLVAIDRGRELISLATIGVGVSSLGAAILAPVMGTLGLTIAMTLGQYVVSAMMFHRLSRALKALYPVRDVR